MRARKRAGVLSVVVVNYRGTDDTIACLEAFQNDLDWPSERLELIVVDNASRDGRLEELKQALPGVRRVMGAAGRRGDGMR